MTSTLRNTIRLQAVKMLAVLPVALLALLPMGCGAGDDTITPPVSREVLIENLVFSEVTFEVISESADVRKFAGQMKITNRNEIEVSVLPAVNAVDKDDTMLDLAATNFCRIKPSETATVSFTMSIANEANAQFDRIVPGKVMGIAPW